MVRLLINCYYDGMTLSEAKAFIKRCYEQTPKEKDIQQAVEQIKSCTNKEWK